MKPENYGGIVEISAAIREYYGLDHSAESDPDVLHWLNSHQFRCVVVLLIDGMGTSIMNRHLSKEGFFLSHTVKEVSTVFPPTTTAAATAFLTGKYPCETAWLGWNQYFPEINDELILFRDAGQYSRKWYPNYAWEHLPIKLLPDELKEKGIRSESVWPEWGQVNPCDSYTKMMNKTIEFAGKPGMRSVYSYWDALDITMHINGPHSEIVTRILKRIEEDTAMMYRHLPEDCGLLIIADHGQVCVRHYSIDRDEEFCSYLAQAPTIEARAASFYIKEGMKEAFELYFNKKFGHSFRLIRHEDVLKEKWFGPGTPHPRLSDFIGDYLAIAVSDLQLDYSRGKETRGNHAGGLREEAMIPVILVP